MRKIFELNKQLINHAVHHVAAIPVNAASFFFFFFHCFRTTQTACELVLSNEVLSEGGAAFWLKRYIFRNYRACAIHQLRNQDEASAEHSSSHSLHGPFERLAGWTWQFDYTTVSVCVRADNAQKWNRGTLTEITASQKPAIGTARREGSQPAVWVGQGEDKNMPKNLLGTDIVFVPSRTVWSVTILSLPLRCPMSVPFCSLVGRWRAEDARRAVFRQAALTTATSVTKIAFSGVFLLTRRLAEHCPKDDRVRLTQSLKRKHKTKPPYRL